MAGVLAGPYRRVTTVVMLEETDAELRLKQILKANPDRLSRFRAASVAFAIVPGSN